MKRKSVKERIGQLRSHPLGGILVAASVATVVIIVAILTRQEQVSAKSLLQKAFAPPVITADQVSEARSETMRRIPNEINDPYHKPIAAAFIEINWVRGRDRAIRYEKRDATTNELVSIIQVIDGKLRLIDPINNVNSVESYPLPSSSIAPGEQEALRSLGNSKVETIPNSDWGREAWLITSSTMFDQQTVLKDQLANEFPELALIGVETQWQIDRQSGQLIRSEQYGITSNGSRELISSIKSQPAKVLMESDLPPDWFNIDSPITIQPMSNTASDSNNSISLASVITSNMVVGEKVASLPNGYLSVGERWNEYEITRALNGFSPSHPSTGQAAFSPLSAATYGVAIEQVWRNGDRYIALVQGPGSQLVPLMKTTTPVYAKSEKISLQVVGQPIDAWLASGGQFALEPSKQALMFETEGLFFYVFGQSVSSETLVSFTRDLSWTGR